MICLVELQLTYIHVHCTLYIVHCTGCPRKNTLIKFLDKRSYSSPARRHSSLAGCGERQRCAPFREAAAESWPQCLRAGEEHDLLSKNFIRVFFLGHPVGKHSSLREEYPINYSQWYKPYMYFNTNCPSSRFHLIHVIVEAIGPVERSEQG